MVNEQRRLNTEWSPRAALALVLAGLLPLAAARAQVPTEVDPRGTPPPGFEAPQPVAEADRPPPPVTLRGLIRSKGHRKPLVGAVLVSDAAPVETGPDGRFEARLPPGTQAVRINPLARRGWVHADT